MWRRRQAAHSHGRAAPEPLTDTNSSGSGSSSSRRKLARTAAPATPVTGDATPPAARGFARHVGAMWTSMAGRCVQSACTAYSAAATAQELAGLPPGGSTLLPATSGCAILASSKCGGRRRRGAARAVGKTAPAAGRITGTATQSQARSGCATPAISESTRRRSRRGGSRRLSRQQEGGRRGGGTSASHEEAATAC